MPSGGPEFGSVAARKDEASARVLPRASRRRRRSPPSSSSSSPPKETPVLRAGPLRRSVSGAWEKLMMQTLQQDGPIRAWHKAVELAEGSNFAEEPQALGFTTSCEFLLEKVGDNEHAAEALTRSRDMALRICCRSAENATKEALSRWRRLEKEKTRSGQPLEENRMQWLLESDEAAPKRDAAALQAIIAMRRFELQAANHACQKIEGMLQVLQNYNAKMRAQKREVSATATAIKKELGSRRDAEVKQKRDVEQRAQAVAAAEALQVIDPLRKRVEAMLRRREELQRRCNLKTCRVLEARTLDAGSGSQRMVVLVFRGGHSLRIVSSNEGDSKNASSSGSPLVWLRYEPRMVTCIRDKVGPSNTSGGKRGRNQRCVRHNPQIEDHLCRAWLAALGTRPGAPQSSIAVLPLANVPAVIRRLNANLSGVRELAAELAESSRMIANPESAS